MSLTVTAACGDFDFDMPPQQPTGCFLDDSEDTYNPNGEQTYYAATIAAVGSHMEVPDRGITIALATAWQESSMSNIDYGDRDSVGLFQQRPSQGWGSEEELTDPVYASTAFYNKLVTINGWQEMNLAEAAQAVQISAHPEKYAKWGPESELLTEVFAGGMSEGVVCSATRSADDGSTSTDEFVAEYQRNWSASNLNVDGTDLTVDVADSQNGWAIANWAVTRSTMYAIESVSYDGKHWQPEQLEWLDTDTEGSTSTVTITLTEPTDEAEGGGDGQ